jgi:GH24 family phage-related lysozyme (muramidase)
MNPNRFLGVLFCLAICFQLFCNNFTPVENNTEVMKTDSVFNVSPLFNIPEQTQKFEQKKLNRPNKYKLSKVGKDFIKSKETCVLTAYNDPDPQRRSVGWGHQIQPGENLEHISQKKADELFEKDIEWVNDAINRLIKQHDRRFIYSQGFIDGLGSLIYNCGERGVTLTEFWNRWSRCRYDKNTPGFINQNDLNFTIAAVKTSRISAKGHIERRYDEHKLMLN